MQAATLERDAACPCEKKCERDGLCIPVRKDLIIGLRKQQASPVFGKTDERLLVLLSRRTHAFPLGRQLIEYLPAQQARQWGNRADKGANGGDGCCLPR